MKLNKNIHKFNNTVKLLIKNDKQVVKKINLYFNDLKKLFFKNNLHLKKVGDFYYNTYLENKKVFDLELCVAKYCKSNKILFNLYDKVLNIVKNYSQVKEIHKDKNYLNLVFNFQNNTINFRIVICTITKKNNKLVYEILRNGIIQEDLLICASQDFKKANKLSSNLLFSIKKIINYITIDDFNYTYNIDYILLRWFYEYVSKSVEEHIFFNFIKKDQQLNLSSFLKTKNLKNWIKKNISFFDLINFIFLKVDSVNTYYFNQFNFQLEEMFDGISRYSINTNSSLKLPIDYFSDLKIFDTSVMENKIHIQNNLSNENGLSYVSWSKFKDYGHRYIISPVIKTGIANFPIYKKWIVVKANELYMQLPEDIKKDIKTTKQREAMNGLNELANKWLAKYYLKIKYLQPYFDKKYPFASYYTVDELAQLIYRTINNIKDQEWIIKNDN